jgi:hypothetical protein
VSLTAGPVQQAPASSPPPGRRRSRWRTPAIVVGGVVVLAGIGAGVAFLVWSPVGIHGDGTALAGLDLPPGASVSQARAIGPHGTIIPLTLRGDTLWPSRPLPSGERLRVSVTVHRPSEVGWLVGDTSHLTMTLRTPTAHLTKRWVSVAAGKPLRVAFDQPVRAVVTGSHGVRTRHALPRAERTVTVPHAKPAGAIAVAAAVRPWERPAPLALLSWFPAGPRPVALARPGGGARLMPNGQIRLTLSKPVGEALGSARPTITPKIDGTWRTVDRHTLTFTPKDLGFPFGAKVRMTLPQSVGLVGSGGQTVTWRVPGASEDRLQQILATLGYLPLSFRPAHPIAKTADAQIAAAISAPKGRYSWRYANTPAALRALWHPGEDGTMTRGALMAFERDHGLTTDGLAGSQVWPVLLSALRSGQRNTSGYTYVMVSRAVPQALQLWVSGHVILQTPVNTGIASAPTAPGTYPVFEHISSGTMSGTNPDGTHYNDPGVPWISYFNGGDALHGFPRGSYGVPQSLGCVEIPIGTAAKVWPHTPVGTLVTIA